MLAYIPKGMDIDALIAQHPPRFKSFKKDFLIYIIDRILMRAQFKKDTIYSDYVSLHSELLQSIKPNYKAHLTYLIEQKVIECDNRYIKGEKAKGYRLTDKYGYEVGAVKLTDFVLIKKLKILRERNEQSVKDMGYLTKWFGSKLQIHAPLVESFLSYQFQALQGQPHLWAKKRVKNSREIKTKQPAKQYQNGLLSALRISNGDYYFKRDSTSRRFHSNPSNMPKILRNALSYDGRNLISLDIKNSQPFLSLCILNPNFWNEDESLNDIDNSLNSSQNLQSSHLLNISHILNYSSKTKHFSHYTMLGEVVKSLIDADFTRYIEIVSEGRFYENLVSYFRSKTGVEMGREEMKEIVFLIFFGGEQGGTIEDIAKKRLFRELFPEVSEVFSAIKRNKKEVLSCLLQTIESYLIIEVIAKRIALEYPKAPIITIHDSIATTVDYVDEVTKIMLEELEKAVGYKPTLDAQEWKPEVLQDYINQYGEKTAKAA